MNRWTSSSFERRGNTPHLVLYQGYFGLMKGWACNQATYHRLTSWDHLGSFGVRCIASRYFGCDRSWSWWKSWSQSHTNGEANGAIAATRRNVFWLQSKVLIISGSKMIHDDTFTFTFLYSVQPSSKASRWKFEKSCLSVKLWCWIILILIGRYILYI